MLGALLGSFANVLASRGPRKWGLVEAGTLPSGIAFPPSRCEGCALPIPRHNLIPIVSYLMLRGRCPRCGIAIGWRHLLVETLGAGAGVLAVLLFGLTVQAAGFLILAILLIALAVIDQETGYLPDALTLPLVGLGLAFALADFRPGLLDAGLGVLLGGGLLWLLAEGYAKLRGRTGLGGGDVKLVAAAGAWCGAYALPFILFFASAAGLVAAIALRRRGEENLMTAEIRFGPYLCAAIAIVYAAGPPLTLA